MKRRRKKRRWLWVLVGILAVLAVIAYPAYKEAQKLNHPIAYAEEVSRWAAEYQLDPLLLYAVISTESGFRPDAVSNMEARGLMQMTEETFDWVKTKIAPEEQLSFDDMFVPNQSIRFGGWFLAYCMEKYGGDVGTAAAAYHSGMGTVDILLEKQKYSADGITLKDSPHRDMNHYMFKVRRAYSAYQNLYGKKA